MELALKVGGAQDPIHWRDGQIIDIRPDGFHNGNLTRAHHCILTLPGDYWQIRGSTDWKWPGQKVYNNIQKYITAVDSQGKYLWERAVPLEEKRLRRRDWFIDFKLLLDLGLITESQFDSIYNKEKDPGIIYIERAFDELIKHEDQHQRLKSKYSLSKGTVSSGTYSIGSGLNYETITTFEADIIAPATGPLTGNLTGEHNAEETTISSNVTFDIDTATYLFKLTAQSGDEHNGGAYGNGARINYGSPTLIIFDETTDGDMDDVEVSKLALDIGGNNNGLYLSDGANLGTWLINRLLMKGDSINNVGINALQNVKNIIISNNIIYGLTEINAVGILLYTHDTTEQVYNNTVIGCYNNFRQDDDTYNGTLTFKNNLAQADAGGSDYADDGAGFGTTGTNVSEDATSPDAAYQSKDVHTNSVFLDYANNDYRLDSGGDATNLAILDDGEDLSATFTDDIQGQTRSTWYIGASEIVAAAGTLYQVTCTDGFKEGDSLDPVTWFLCSLTDGSKGGDTHSGRGQFVPSLSNGFKEADAISAKAIFPTGVVDGLSLGETLMTSVVFLTVLSDGVDWADTPIGKIVAEANVQDGLDTADSLSALLQIVEQVIDGMKPGDSVDFILAALQFAVTDGLKAVDSLSAVLQATEQATDGFKGVDSPDTTLDIRSTVSDGLKAVDSLSTVLKIMKQTTDGMKPGDSLQVVLRLVPIVTDGLKAVDSLSAVLKIMKQATDGLDAGDSVDFILAALQLAVSEGLKTVDSLSTVLQVVEQATDGFKGVDASSVLALLRPIVGDGLKLGDSAFAAILHILQAVDGMKAGDTDNIGCIFEMRANDSVQFAETVSTLVQFVTLITDGGKLGDVASHILVSVGTAEISFTLKGRKITFVVKNQGLDFVKQAEKIDFTVH